MSQMLFDTQAINLIYQAVKDHPDAQKPERKGMSEIYANKEAVGNKDEDGSLTKAEYLALEKCFSAEISTALNGHPLPFQSKAKVMEQLERRGFVVKVSEIIGGRFPVAINGWTLTERGRLAYCLNCK